MFAPMTAMMRRMEAMCRKALNLPLVVSEAYQSKFPAKVSIFEGSYKRRKLKDYFSSLEFEDG
jgi:hypothetical protein